MSKKINPFRFKQFIVHHDRCAMKVGTDAVLLGAWVNAEQAQTVLDIGAGSGVIALMLAQRTRSSTTIDAVEIELNSFLQSNENVARSPWPEKIRTHHSSIQEFGSDQKYDLIVSNPPYFVNSLLPPAFERRDARHSISLSHTDLLTATQRLLKSSGKLGIILPTLEGDQFQVEAIPFGLYCLRRTAFYSRAKKPQERWLLEFGYSQPEIHTESLMLYHHGTELTSEYKSMTSEFYL